MAQKLARAVESENQLAEVMTDFWFNHFNVSLTDNKARPYLLSYERDAIRPHALGSFRDLLGGHGQEPGHAALPRQRPVLGGAEGAATMHDDDRTRPRSGRHGRGGGLRTPAARAPRGSRRRASARPKRPRGVNENYARELMELHTLGVDGGYTQQDVIEVARAFTGWTILPAGPGPARRPRRGSPAPRRAGGLGFHQEGDFLFRADQHDAGAKTVLGTQLPGRPRDRGRRGGARPAGRPPRHRPPHRRPSSPSASSPTTRRRRWWTG